jgi:hypothetical protein
VAGQAHPGMKCGVSKHRQVNLAGENHRFLEE